MKTIVYLNYLEDQARKNQFEVRKVNSWTAYNWLSKGTTEWITKTMELRKANATVHDLLRVALLLEHGGVMINEVDTFIFEGGFKWLENVLSGAYSANKDYSCDSASAKILMAQDEHPYYVTKYSSSFIAVKSGNSLLREVLEEMIFFYK